MNLTPLHLEVLFGFIILFYKNGKKILPLNMEEFITPLTLAI